MQALPQQERRYLLALGPQILHRRSTRSGEIAHGLVAPVGNPHRGQLAGAQQLDPGPLARAELAQAQLASVCQPNQEARGAVAQRRARIEQL